VLKAIQKPRVTKKAPTVVVKKKKVIPSRVKVESNPGKSPPEAGTTMTTTNLNVGRLKPQNTGFVSPAREPRIVPQDTGFVSPATGSKEDFGGLPESPNIVPQNYGFTNPADNYPGNLRQGALEAELRDQKVKRPTVADYAKRRLGQQPFEVNRRRKYDQDESFTTSDSRIDPSGVGSTITKTPPPPQVEDTEHVGFGNWNPGGSAKSLLSWVKRRNARRMLDM
jgi:hypothetical protein